MEWLSYTVRGGAEWYRLDSRMAEREGFEPPEPFGSTVFKTAAFDRSATSPRFGKQPLALALLAGRLMPLSKSGADAFAAHSLAGG